ncbi:MAG: hypothetical protein H8E37_08770 [Planctomycetes bacterium]|nr:hypothetical protein [Planctomycetota bacterium]
MSRKKKSPASATQSDSPAQNQQPSASAKATAAEASTTTSRWKQIGLAVFVLAAIWYVALISLAAFTGNPVTINRLQIKQSDLVVSGSVDENGTISHILVHKVNGIIPAGEIRVTPFDWPPGDYILPLKNKDSQLQVTLSELPGNPPLIYPSNEKSIKQLQQILKEK